MARTFSKNTSNILSLGANTLNPLMSGATVISFHLWIWITSTTTTSHDNRILCFIQGSGNLNSVSVSIENTGAPRNLRILCRSTEADSAQIKLGTVDISTGTWHSVGGVINYTAGTVTPYVDGSADNGGAVTFGSSTYTNSTTPGDADAIGMPNGAPALTGPMFDGRICEVAVWKNVDLGSEGFTLLNNKVSANFVKPANLIMYMPLIGSFSPEIDLIDGKKGTISGSVPQVTHQQISYHPYVPTNTIEYVKVGNGMSRNELAS